MRITYFANDLADAATVRRVQVLCMGGVNLTLVGFRRIPTPITEVAGVKAIDLGQTYSGRLGHRLMQVICRSVGARKWRAMVEGADSLLARNLEMATIAVAARRWAGAKQVPLVYECLDIHASQLGTGASSKLLRKWERQILHLSSALVTSSQAFVTNYFDKLAIKLPPIILAENKRVLPEPERDRPCDLVERNPPWRINWLGLLRCAESFGILLKLAQRRSDVDITLRGRPVPMLQQMIDAHLPLPNMRFDGPYTQDDLATIYSACDLVWAVEYIGQNATNARWALGNRLYEGGYYNCPVIALADSAMGAWLHDHNVGVFMHDPHTELEPFIAGLTKDRYHSLQQASAQVPTCQLAWTRGDCLEFSTKIALMGASRYVEGAS